MNNVPTSLISVKPKSKTSVTGEIVDSLLYFAFRLLAVVIGFYIGYLLAIRFKPVLGQLCLSNTDDCMTIQLYRYKNTFLARDDVSQIWFWYNGENLFVYGQVPGICTTVNDQQYYPVNVFKMGFDNDKKLVTFSTLPNRCIDSTSSLINYYKNNLKIPLESFIIKRSSTTASTTVYQIVQALYNAKVFTFANDV
jgi:hypothetical protein